MYTPWVGYVPPPRPPIAPAQPVPDGNASRCAKYVVFGLRGSGEEPQADWNIFLGWDKPAFVGETDGFGTYNEEIYAAFDRFQPGTKKRVAVQYQALPVPVLDPRVSPSAYMDSIFDGVDKLISRAYEEASDCPDSEFVLLGYSQGALAAHVAMRVLAESDLALLERFVAVGFVSDPGRVVGGGEDLWRTASLVNGQLQVSVPGLLESISPGVWSLPTLWQETTPSGPLPDIIASRTTALCHNGDLICASFLGAGASEHTNYTNDELEALGYMVAFGLPGG
nr:cutinase family protein [Ornithinimicrobium sediminis]